MRHFGKVIVNKVEKCCASIGTSLKQLEEGTLHANLAELRIGLIKEAVSKHMMLYNLPLMFWVVSAELGSTI